MQLVVKVTQINFVSRNQLHNPANSCQHLNFGLTWLEAKCKVRNFVIEGVACQLQATPPLQISLV